MTLRPTRWLLTLGLSGVLCAASAAWAGPTTTSTPGTTTTSSVPGTTTTSTTAPATTTTAPATTTTSTSSTSTTLPEGHKVEVCHKGHAISIDRHALEAHLRHGDSVGACGGSSDDDEEESSSHGGKHSKKSAEHDDRDEPEDSKRVVCHDGRKTKTVSARRVEKHLRHGDTLGSCV